MATWRRPTAVGRRGRCRACLVYHERTMSKCALRCVQQPVWSPLPLTAPNHTTPRAGRKAHDLARPESQPVVCRSTLLTPDMDVPAMRSTWRLPSCGLDLMIRENRSQEPF